MDQVITTYKTLHQFPQIGLQEYQTTAFILDYISNLDGVHIVHPKNQQKITGVICYIEGENNTLPTYLFRADIDALPLQEQSGLDYSSKNGLHHACGHDAHTAILLSAIKEITKNREKINRKIIFCFQPGEQGKAGASKLLAAYPTLLDPVDYCFALHVGNYLPTGVIDIPIKYVTCNSNSIKIEIFGQSSHCLSYYSAIDANFIGCQLMQEIYSIKNRLVPPDVQMALCIPKFEGGKNGFSISDYFSCTVSLRDYDPQYHQKVIDHIKNATKCYCDANGAKFSISVSENMYRTVKNDEKAIVIMQGVVEQIYGKDQTKLQPKGSFAGQDFCEFSEKKPSCYIIFGTALPDSISPTTKESIFPVHSSRFKLNEYSLTKPVQIWTKLAFSTK